MTETAERRAHELCTEPDYRFTLANERTFLAWQRTSLGLLAASLAALHFLADQAGPAFANILGAGLGALAAATALGGLLRWRRNDAAIRLGGPLPVPRMLTVLALVLAVIGLTGVVAAIVLSL